jgi:hypothetical protein
MYSIDCDGVVRVNLTQCSNYDIGGPWIPSTARQLGQDIVSRWLTTRPDRAAEEKIIND